MRFILYSESKGCDSVAYGSYDQQWWLLSFWNSEIVDKCPWGHDHFTQLNDVDLSSAALLVTIFSFIKLQEIWCTFAASRSIGGSFTSCRHWHMQAFLPVEALESLDMLSSIGEVVTRGYRKRYNLFIEDCFTLCCIWKTIVYNFFVAVIFYIQYLDTYLDSVHRHTLLI